MQSQVVAVSKEDADAVGAIVYFRRGGSVSYSEMRQAWESEGFEPEAFPNLPSTGLALKRAMGAQSERRRMVRPLEHGSGYALVDETADENDLSYKVELKVSLKDGVPVVSPDDHPLAHDVVQSWAHYRTNLIGQDISSWMIRIADSCDAVSLRDTGGVYFIAKSRLYEFRQKAALIEGKTGAKVFEIPAMDTASSIEAILDAITREAQTEIDDLESFLYPAHEDDNPGKRALTNRTKRTERLKAKVSTFEELLGSRITDFQDKIGELETQLVTATLAALGGDE